MGWTEKLDSYEMLSIGLVVSGVGVILAGQIMQYLLNVYMFHFHSLSHTSFGRLLSASGSINMLGTFIMGVGLFLGFRRIDDKINVHEYFQYINFTYLILLFPNLVYVISSFFYDGLTDLSLLTLIVYWFGILLLPSITYILMIVMILLIFMKIYRKESILIEK